MDEILLNNVFQIHGMENKDIRRLIIIDGNYSNEYTDGMHNKNVIFYNAYYYRRIC